MDKSHEVHVYKKTEQFFDPKKKWKTLSNVHKKKEFMLKRLSRSSIQHDQLDDNIVNNPYSSIYNI